MRFNLMIRETDGTVKKHRVALGPYCIGRDKDCQIVVVSADVSRRHATLTFEEKGFVIEDLGSSSGTRIEGHVLTKPTRLEYPAEFEIGSAAVWVEPAADGTPKKESPPSPAPFSNDHHSDPVRITVSIDALSGKQLPLHGMAEQMAMRLEMLYDLPLQFASEPDLPKLYRLILRRVMDLVPGAVRGALLIIDPAADNKLVLRASEPAESPPISRTLIKRAAGEQQGFIWGDEGMEEARLSMSIVKLSIRTGMYVPLLWKGKTVGVLCVDNPQHRHAFRQEDLQFLISVAHYAAAAVANQLLQDDIETNNRTLQHLLANFSPKLRGKLMQKSREGRLQPGGEKSTVTILMSDLRGFTKTSAPLDSESVVLMLNDYFSALGDIIFQHDGTIDKFIGDAILAVFGSPEPDPQHALKATRCAVAMQSAIHVINARRRADGLPCCDLGIGVCTGEVLHGFIGAKERLEFTVIGDTVNKASRYCDAARAGEILLSPQTNTEIQNEVETQPCRVSTKHEGELDAFRIM